MQLYPIFFGKGTIFTNISIIRKFKNALNIDLSSVIDAYV